MSVRESETSSAVPETPAVREKDSAIDDVDVMVFTPDSSLQNPLTLAKSIATDVWMGRELAWRMFVRNLRGLYRQTLLGIFWAFLPPLANTAVWWFINNSKAIELDKGLTVSYIVYLMTGMVIWQSFVEAFQAPLSTVNANKGMLGKLRFPRESLLVVSFLDICFNLCVRMVVLIPIMLYFGAALTPWLLVAPIAVMLLVCVGMGLGLLLMPIGMLYQDVGRFITLITPIWMILTPIVYKAPDGWGSSWWNWLNPASPLLSAARDLIVLGTTDQGAAVIFYAAIAFPLLIFGLIVYRLSIPILVERIAS